MKPIALWHHSKISGEGIPNPDFAADVLVSQMLALEKSGLAAAASEIHHGIIGPYGDIITLAMLANNKAEIHCHGEHARTEIPTLNLIRQWLPAHPDWLVLYHHTKGVTHPGEKSYEVWRQRMEDACVWNWQQCVADLEAGYEAVGCHWLTPEKYRAAVTSPFFGGTFWWSTSRYLSQLPELPEPTWLNRFEAESWIGRRRPYPRIRDYYPGWP
jgi:hypothetical protein